LAFRSSCHVVLARQGRHVRARLRPGGRLRPCDGCAAPCPFGPRAIPPDSELEAIMNDKSHVSLEQHVCLVCGSAFDTGAILLDKRLRQSMERHTVNGWGLCPEHERLFKEGYVALVECDPQRSGGAPSSGSMKPEQAYRPGRLAH